VTYVLDANVFIQAKNLQYGFDFCPAFWDWLDEHAAVERVVSIEKVLDELKAGGDDLSAWAIARRPMFKQPDAPVVASLQAVSNWAASAHYDPAAVSTFFQDADFYLVAHAQAHGLTVVTHEVPANSVKKLKIPNACIALGIKCMTPYEMLRVERARFILGRAA
jgi:predicted nucleic acid-binding protein